MNYAEVLDDNKAIKANKIVVLTGEKTSQYSAKVRHMHMQIILEMDRKAMSTGCIFI